MLRATSRQSHMKELEKWEENRSTWTQVEKSFPHEPWSQMLCTKEQHIGHLKSMHAKTWTWCWTEFGHNRVGELANFSQHVLVLATARFCKLQKFLSLLSRPLPPPRSSSRCTPATETNWVLEDFLLRQESYHKVFWEFLQVISTEERMFSPCCLR